jgi:hypothetical protein
MKAKDYAQRFSVGTLYHEGRDRILLSATVMAGGYVSSSSSSSSNLNSSCGHINASAPHTAVRDLLASASSSPVANITGKGKGKKSADSCDSGPSWEEAIAAAAAAGGGREREITQAESMDLFAAESMDGEIEPVLSSSSVRLKGTQERERADREFRGKWSGLMDLALGMLSRPKTPAGRAEGLTDTGSCGSSSAGLGNGIGPGNSSTSWLDSNGQGQGAAAKGRTKKVKESAPIGLSAAPTVAAAQALLDESCSMQPYVNQPGEVFAEVMRSTLGELMMVSIMKLSLTCTCALSHFLHKDETEGQQCSKRSPV